MALGGMKSLAVSLGLPNSRAFALDPLHTCEVDLECLAAWASKAGDVDMEVLTWLHHGVPLGIDMPMENSGVFPQVDKRH
eukprot:6316215-Amphidinium_carterae.2